MFNRLFLNKYSRFLNLKLKSYSNEANLAAGSDYFAKIAKQADENVNSMEDLSLDKEINLVKSTGKNVDSNLKQKSQNYAKKFLTKQIEYHKKYQSKPEQEKEPQSKLVKRVPKEMQERKQSYLEFRHKTEEKKPILPSLELKPEIEEPLELEKEENLTEQERIELQIKNLRPAIRPVVYNLAYFVNKNEVLKKLVEMGVFIRKWDKDTSIGSFILQLDMEKDVKPHLIFLHDIGIPPESHAFVITKNPHFFLDSIEDLNVRIEYLKSKNFTPESIKEIIVQAPKWLSLSVDQVDSRLGWLQKEFGLNGSEVREIITQRAKLVTLPLKKVSDIKFGLKEFLTYDDKQIKAMLKMYPKLFTKEFSILEANFVFLSQVCKLTHEHIASHPPVLVAPLLMLKSRYSYLKHLNRIQFDPSKPNFVSLKMLIEPEDRIFCQKSAKTSLDDYKKFLKTL